ncbi:MAG: saccharopine dehydrogenase NADP-binding domain-containing protein [Pseudomonadales bacterium]|nr:saccharopine dehydrogenase NADP-binding domain-containing protein [Pseudomonadales bacterium]
MQKKWMIYGANGYTGELIAREAVKRGYKPVVAGRNRDKIEALANELALESRIFELKDPSYLNREMDGLFLIIHCAGPFSVTAEPMMQACIACGVHYLDITGEINIFELAQTMDCAAREANVVICPGVGFDVIPTDCIAATLQQAMPDATHLALGFDTGSGMSPGTAKTSIEGMSQGGKVRQNGDIVTVSLGHKVRSIDFGCGEKLAMAIPWGDVATAYYTTRIQNIEVFMPANRAMIIGAKVSNFFRPLFAMPRFQSLLKAIVERTIKGPKEERRAQLPTFVWGEVRNARGQVKTARARTDNVYSLTIFGAVAVIEYLLGHAPNGGTYTPAKLVGADLVTCLPGSTPIDIT